MSPIENRYRPEIDGLRAVAVLAVVLFHLDWGSIPGGYVGVDVFFVISGYLISRKILSDAEQGRFSLKEFYLARVRRIVPALTVTCGLTLAAAIALLSPRLLIETAWSTLAAIGSFSNVLFFSEANYFDSAAYYKPLLHTWSLGVEEQFYLVWPTLTLLWVKLKSPGARAILFALASLSMAALSEWAVDWHPEGAYFLTPFRVFEFMMGAAVVRVEGQRPRHSLLTNGLTACGLLLLLAPVFAYSEETRFPGWAAVPPCLGAAIVIWAGENAFSRFFLATKPVLFIGKISYSLYLVHWPVVVFAGHHYLGVHGAGYDAVLLVSMLTLSYLMYRFVETPFRTPEFRRRMGTRRLFLSFAVSSSLIASVSAAAITGRGWPARIAGPQELIANLQGVRKATWKYVESADSPGQRPFGGSAQRILLLGDSHSKDLFNALHLGGGIHGMEFRWASFKPNCLPLLDPKRKTTGENRKEADCLEDFEALSGSNLMKNATLVVVAMRWFPGATRSLKYVRDLPQAADKPFLLMDRRIEFADIPELIARTGSVETAQAELSETELSVIQETNAALVKAARKAKLRVLSWYRIACDDDLCPIANPRELYYLDGHHWSFEGAKRFAPALLELLEPAFREYADEKSGQMAP